MRIDRTVFIMYTYLNFETVITVGRKNGVSVHKNQEVNDESRLGEDNCPGSEHLAKIQEPVPFSDKSIERNNK